MPVAKQTDAGNMNTVAYWRKADNSYCKFIDVLNRPHMELGRESRISRLPRLFQQMND
jgi:hypothetical protein